MKDMHQNEVGISSWKCKSKLNENRIFKEDIIVENIKGINCDDYECRFLKSVQGQIKLIEKEDVENDTII